MGLVPPPHRAIDDLAPTQINGLTDNARANLFDEASEQYRYLVVALADHLEPVAGLAGRSRAGRLR